MEYVVSLMFITICLFVFIFLVIINLCTKKVTNRDILETFELTERFLLDDRGVKYDNERMERAFTEVVNSGGIQVDISDLENKDWIM